MCIYNVRSVTGVKHVSSRYLRGTQSRNAFNFLYVPPRSVSARRFLRKLSFFGPLRTYENRSGISVLELINSPWKLWKAENLITREISFLYRAPCLATILTSSFFLFFSFFITSRQTFMTQTSDQSPIPLRQILIFSVFNLINVVHVQFKVWDFETIWLIGNYFSH